MIEPPVLTLQNEIMKLQREVVALTEARDKWVRHAGDAVAYAESLKSEPPVLSRAQMYELIDGRRSVIHYGDFKDTPGAYSYAKAGARMLADAILESLSQEASE